MYNSEKNLFCLAIYRYIPGDVNIFLEAWQKSPMVQNSQFILRAEKIAARAVSESRSISIKRELEHENGRGGGGGGLFLSSLYREH